MQNKLERYAQLKLEEARIADELKALKSEVSSLVFEAEGEKIETEWGKFELRAGRKTWKYSEELTAKENQVKEMFKIKRKEEEIKGIAVLEAAPTNLVFTAKKA